MAKSPKQQAYLTRRSNQNMAQATEDIETAKAARERALKGLAEVQASRPLKPPGRR